MLKIFSLGAVALALAACAGKSVVSSEGERFRIPATEDGQETAFNETVGASLELFSSMSPKTLQIFVLPKVQTLAVKTPDNISVLGKPIHFTATSIATNQKCKNFNTFLRTKVNAAEFFKGENGNDLCGIVEVTNVDLKEQKNSGPRRALLQDQPEQVRVFLNQNYPSFTPKDISQLMRLVLSKKINESQEDIKRVLTENNKLPNQSANKVPQQAQINERLSNAIGHGHHVIDVGPINYGGKSGQGTNAGQFTISNSTNTRSKLAVAPRSHYSNTSRNSSSTSSVNPYTIANRRKKSNGSLKTIAIAFCAALAIFGSLNWVMKARRQPALFLQTTPPTVKVYYNQSALFSGAYVSSPISVHEIPEGKGTVTITREGYEAYRFNIDYKKGRQINNESIVLKQTGKFSPVKIMSKPSSESADVIINDGFIKGTAPLNAQDLAYGKSHEIKVIPKTDGKSAFTCRFTPTSVDFLDPYILGLDLNKRQCFQIKK